MKHLNNLKRFETHRSPSHRKNGGRPVFSPVSRRFLSPFFGIEAVCWQGWHSLCFCYEDLRQINPALVYGCVSGFGHYSPYSQRAGYDIIGQAMSGLMSTTGWPGGEPTRTGTAIADVMAGLSCCVGILSAYINRLKTGQGEKVDVALVDSMVSSLEIINIIYLCTGKIPQRIGNRYEAIYPYDSFRASDGSLVIGAGNDKLFRLLCGVMEMPELLEDPRFNCNNQHQTNIIRTCFR